FSRSEAGAAAGAPFSESSIRVEVDPPGERGAPPAGSFFVPRAGEEVRMVPRCFERACTSSIAAAVLAVSPEVAGAQATGTDRARVVEDRKSTRLNSSH